MTLLSKAAGGLRSIGVIVGLALFGLIFIIAPGLAADLGFFWAGCLADE